MPTYTLGTTANLAIDDILDDAGLPLSSTSNGGPGWSPKPDGLLTNPAVDGNLGNANSTRRGEWAAELANMNTLIQRAAGIFGNTSSQLKAVYFPVLSSQWINLSEIFLYNDISAFEGYSRANAERFFWSELNGPESYTVKNTILLYQALLGDGGYDPLPDASIVVTTDGTLGRWSLTRVRDLIFVVDRELTLREDARDAAIETEEYILNSTGIDYSATDVDFILSNDEWSRWFSTTFDSDSISLVPLIYNFYLTGQYFPELQRAFRAPKDRVMSILISTIANDNNFDANPDMSRPASNAALASSTGQDQTVAFNSAARDFILKMLIKTPIDILKGVVELTDPHVAITKVIKTGTGFAFNSLAEVMDSAGIAEGVNEALTQIGLDPTLNGEDLAKLLLCLIDFAMQEGMTAGIDALQPPPDDGNPGVPENFFPRVSLDGVDFTGTISGMLMMPPGPLGIIYLLLELLRSEIDNQNENVSNASAENALANECNDDAETEET
tara:strand:+ start:6616 stop:8115 length:1500 start_codon:yes stop_codon:yes gene_type:complete